MVRFLLLIADLFVVLPWWGALAVLISLPVGLWALASYFMKRLHREMTQAVKAQGEPLANALVTVHSVKPAERPSGPSLLDDFDDESDDADDEYYDPDTDGMFATDDSGYAWIEATIAPQDVKTVWDPSMLSLVPADFTPDTELEISHQTAILHSLEVWRNGRFEAQGSQNVTGTQRLRMLFAVPNDMPEAKFAYHFTHFGKVTLPAHLAVAR